MKTIWKFTVKSQPGLYIIRVPRHASIIDTQAQHGQISMWAEVETQEPEVDRVIEVFETGTGMHPEKERFRMYLGAVMFDNGNYVLHVFESLED